MKKRQRKIRMKEERVRGKKLKTSLSKGSKLLLLTTKLAAIEAIGNSCNRSEVPHRPAVTRQHNDFSPYGAP